MAPALQRREKHFEHTVERWAVDAGGMRWLGHVGAMAGRGQCWQPPAALRQTTCSTNVLGKTVVEPGLLHSLTNRCASPLSSPRPRCQARRASAVLRLGAPGRWPAALRRSAVRRAAASTSAVQGGDVRVGGDNSVASQHSAEPSGVAP